MKIIFFTSLNIKPFKQSLIERNKNYLENALPVGLLNLCGSIKLKLHLQPIIIDLNLEICNTQFPSPTFFQELYTVVSRKVLSYINTKEFVLFGFQSLCNSHHIALYLANRMKKDFMNSIILMGGPHASITAPQTLAFNSTTDFILAGEADFTIVDFIRSINGQLDYKEVPGLFYKTDDGQVIQPEFYDLPTDLNDLPFPDYSSYQYPIPGLYIEVGRGCPFCCTYCSTSSFFSRKPRYKSIERISHEIDKALLEIQGYNTVNFIHDHFLAQAMYAEPLLIDLQKVAKRKGLCWTCSVRPDSISQDIAFKLKNSNFTSIYLGIESGSPKMQKYIKKNLNVESALKTVKTLRNFNLETTCSFIQGFPKESKIDLEKTFIAMAQCSLYGAIIQLHPLTWMPGTKLFEKYKYDLIYSPNRENTQYHPNSIIDHADAVSSREIFSVFYKYNNSNPDLEGISRIALTTLQDYPMTLLLMVKPWIEGNLIVDTFIKWKSLIRNEILNISELTLWIGNKLAEDIENTQILNEVFNYEKDRVSAYMALNKQKKTNTIQLDELKDFLTTIGWKKLKISLSNRCVLGSILVAPNAIADSIVKALTTNHFTLYYTTTQRQDYILRVIRNKFENVDSLTYINLSKNIKPIIDNCKESIYLSDLLDIITLNISESEFWLLFAQLLNFKIFTITPPSP